MPGATRDSRVVVGFEPRTADVKVQGSSRGYRGHLIKATPLPHHTLKVIHAGCIQAKGLSYREQPPGASDGVPSLHVYPGTALLTSAVPLTLAVLFISTAWNRGTEWKDFAYHDPLASYMCFQCPT